MMGGLLRNVAGRVGSDGAILCYHSITTPRSPSATRLHVPLHEFETTVRLLRRFADIVALSDLVGRRDSGLRTAGLVALTFDDGYAALLEGVRQTVERDQVPITVFVVSDAARTGSRYWWDRLEDALPGVSADRVVAHAHPAFGLAIGKSQGQDDGQFAAGVLVDRRRPAARRGGNYGGLNRRLDNLVRRRQYCRRWLRSGRIGGHGRFLDWRLALEVQ